MFILLLQNTGDLHHRKCCRLFLYWDSAWVPEHAACRSSKCVDTKIRPNSAVAQIKIIDNYQPMPKMDKNNNLYLNGRFCTQTTTGVQRYASNLVTQFDQLFTEKEFSSLKATLLTPRCRIINELGMRNIQAKAVGYLSGHLWEQIECSQHSRDGLLFSPGNVGPLFNRRQVVTIHDASTLDHPEWFSPRFAAWYRFLLPRLMHRVQRIITDSEFSKQRLLANCQIHDNKVVVIYPGTSIKPLQPITEEAKKKFKQHFKIPSRYVLILGSMEPRKNLKNLLLAWREASPRIGGCTLVVAGGHSKAFDQLDLGQVPENVHFLGYVDDKHLPMLYSTAEGFLFPSLYEGFGLPPLEAMACGVPTLVSNAGSLPEVVGDAALQVDPLDVHAMATAVQRLVEDSELRRGLIEKGYHRSAQFTWQKTANLTLRLLRDTLNEI